MRLIDWFWHSSKYSSKNKLSQFFIESKGSLRSHRLVNFSTRAPTHNFCQPCLCLCLLHCPTHLAPILTLSIYTISAEWFLLDYVSPLEQNELTAWDERRNSYMERGMEENTEEKEEKQVWQFGGGHITFGEENDERALLLLELASILVQQHNTDNCQTNLKICVGPTIEKLNISD